MVLTGIRNNETGDYIIYDTMKQSADEYGIKITECEYGELSNLDAFQDMLKKKEDIEGVVVRFDSGLMYKVKTDWYFARSHKEKQEYSLNSERAIWKLILEQEIDDALTTTKDRHLKNKVMEFQILLWDSIEDLARKLKSFVDKGNFANKLELVNITKGDDFPFHKSLQNIVFKLYDSDMDASGLVLEFAIKSCSSPHKLEKFKKILGISFDESKS
eukprot:TRINITY_DN3256_c0_g2_i3.p1 TRINITY_DN3256_c0_g2~~TRINITY_DN3256_c0_g2_i3.p1  ORF type:complete len:216 (-),score=50.63 TRINITY_DN3256_c0_g2_i3:22-669(-)